MQPKQSAYWNYCLSRPNAPGLGMTKSVHLMKQRYTTKHNLCLFFAVVPMLIFVYQYAQVPIWKLTNEAPNKTIPPYCLNPFNTSLKLTLSNISSPARNWFSFTCTFREMVFNESDMTWLKRLCTSFLSPSGM